MALKKCEKCGQEINYHSKFCFHCGHPQKELNENLIPNKQRSNLYILLVFLIPIIVIALLIYNNNKGKTNFNNQDTSNTPTTETSNNNEVMESSKNEILNSNKNKNGMNYLGYHTLNLEEALKDDEIDYELNNYKETKDQINIYLFRGKGCGYCKLFLEYVANDLVNKYGNYFKLVSFEVWYDEDNRELMNQVADFMGDSVTGVPYIIIGDQTFLGYSSDYNSSIESAITSLYNSKNRYDVFEEMNLS